MLSSLPKLADKPFIIGFVLPVLMFVLSSASLFLDIQLVQTWFGTILTGDALEKLAYLIVGIWVIAVFMLLVNNAQYKLLEGYRWPISRCRRCQARQLARFEKMRNERDRLLDEQQQKADSFSDADLKKLQDASRHLIIQFPSEQHLLPTRFGNAIKAFERYANTVYGADSVALWFHLSAVIPDGFKAELNDARAKVDFLVNVCFFAVLVTVIAIGRFLWGLTAAVSVNPPNLDVQILQASTNHHLLIAFVLAGLTARISYNLSIGQIVSWGNLVKAAFDCYLPDLAKKLGYKLPPTADERKKFWIAVGQRIVYQQPVRPEDWCVAVEEEAVPAAQSAS